MVVPKYHEMMLPILRFLADGHERHRRDFPPMIAEHFHLTEEDRASLLPSGQTTYLQNRAGWANFDLRKAELVEMVRSAVMKITPAGQQFLATKPEKLDRPMLMQFEPFRLFMEANKVTNGSGTGSGTQALGVDAVKELVTTNEATPEERIEEGYTELRAEIMSELLEKVRACNPFFFEHLVVDLLLKMGYGGSRAEAGQATKPTGDGGVDGVINEDRLGLDAIYVQAKRWQNSVGEPQLRDFVGALHAHRARKGVFITTGEFTQTARQYVERVDFKISLIDGQRLAELMLDFNVGVSRARTIEIKRIDNDYFAEG